MTHELILTSVAQGLDPNDSGFCPVVADSEITPRVKEHLLALSGYRYLVTDSGDLSRLSPVAYSHLILPGGLEHVLSCVAGAGTDYQGQPNAFAHHVVLEATECPAESPAWLLALPGFLLSEWSEPPVRFAQGRPIPTLTNPASLTRRQQIARQHRWLDPVKMTLTSSVDIEATAYLSAVQSNDEQIVLVAPPTSPCPIWKELTGDAGWGGILAETVLTGQSVVLVHNPEQNILPLFVEALALLPEYVAWRTTFSTYFSGLPEDIPCQWKGVIAGSEEVKLLVGGVDNIVIDLTIHVGEAPPGRYVNYARQGQEHMLPQDIEEYAAALAAANTKTKSHGDAPDQNTEKFNVSSDSFQIDVSDLLMPKIRLSPKRSNLLETLLHRSSRFQFYLLYGIMFILVLFLLFLAVDQAGDFGLVQKLRRWNQSTPSLQPDDPALEPAPEEKNELNVHAESILLQIEQEIFTSESENARKTFEEDREKQREPLRQFWENFVVPEFLAISFPTVENNQIDPPERKTFGELSQLHPFGAALELQFIPLFELPKMRLETSLVVETLPELLWRTSAVDTETELSTPMFLFRLSETGIDMDWQLEGLNNQYLHETILSSLGFLQLCVADVPESATQIPLFAPMETAPMAVSHLANLTLEEWETPEDVIELPFASELWQEIFVMLDPQRTIRLEVQWEPKGDWVRTLTPSESEFKAEIITTQEARKTTDSGDTFDRINITFMAEVSLEKIVWKGGEYAEQLRLEQENIRFRKEDLERNIGQLDTQIFDGNQSVIPERDELKIALRNHDFRLGEIDSILEKLPSAYRELATDELGRFHYSVFLESALSPRKLLIMRTLP